jgi:hypothetical protein
METHSEEKRQEMSREHLYRNKGSMVNLVAIPTTGTLVTLISEYP